MTAMEKMSVYIEYAFLENVFLDGTLLFFSLRYSGVRCGWRWIVSSLLGGLVAVVYPLLPLPLAVGWIYKLATGALLPTLASGKVGRKKTCRCVGLFFAFSFCVAGGVFAVAEFLPVTGGYLLGTIPLPLCVLFFFSVLCFAAETWRKYRLQRSRTDFLVDCVFEKEEGGVRATGFVDTGNQARVDGLPVCFAAPSVFARLLGEEKVGYALIKTVTGEKKIAVVKMKNLRITHGGQTHIIRKVYLSPSVALVGREYDILLGAWAYD